MTTTVAAAGSCLVRDPFNSQFNPDYKSYFQFTAYHFQPSFISLMAEPAEYDMSEYHWKEPQTKNTDWFTKIELNKSFLNEVYMAQPEILVIDFYSDVLFGVIEFNNTLMTNKSFQFKHNQLFENKFGKTYSMRQDEADYFERFKESFDRFMQFVKQYLPNTCIVVNYGYFESKYRDSEGNIQINTEHSQAYYDELNRWWKKLNDYVVETYDLEAITYDKQYYTTEEYPFGGLYPLHYEKERYHDFQTKLLEIVEKQKDKVHKDVVLPAYNLIQNPNFYRGSADWEGFHLPSFTTLEKGGMAVHSCGKEENIFEQVRAYSIPLEDKDYWLSFEFIPRIMSTMNDNDEVIVLRSFNNRVQFKATDAIWEYKITKKEVMEFLVENDTYRFFKKVHPEGRFLKVIPYMRKNGTFDLEHIEFSTERLEDEYRYPLNEVLAMKENGRKLWHTKRSTVFTALEHSKNLLDKKL